MAGGLGKTRGDRRFEQLTLAQSLSRSASTSGNVAMAATGGDDGDICPNPGNAVKQSLPAVSALTPSEVAASLAEAFGTTAEPEFIASIESDDSEPDPDSSDDWMLSGTDSSRDSSPDDWESSEADRYERSAAPKSSRGRGRGRSRRGEKEWLAGDWQPKKVPFTATPGPQKAAAELESEHPADFLELFLTKELLQHIVEKTNQYAAQYIQANPDTIPAEEWEPLSVQELKRFFGLTFLSGYIRKPYIQLYWSVGFDATPFFSQTMPKNRFQLIWKFLHYNDSTSQDTTDKMYKVRPVLDYIVGKFKELYQPHENICIDEGLMQWHDRLTFKVYNPQKPAKFGIKSYFLCDSITGYCFNMQPYFGQSNTLSERVLSLLDRLPGHGYTLYMDNFFNSVSLCEQLVESKINVCGTLQTNCGEPPIFRQETPEVGEKLVRHNGTVLVVAWQDKRLVRMVTTCHHDKVQTVEVWNYEHCNRVSVLKPECIAAYKEHKYGVGKLDQKIIYYPVMPACLNWPKKFVTYLFQVAMLNAYVLYKAKNPEKCKSILNFMRGVASSWTEPPHVEDSGEEEDDDEDDESRRPSNRAPYKCDPSSRLDGSIGRHQLVYLTPTGKKTRPSRKCRVCSRRGRRSETKMWCKSCRVPLHAGECYTAYHTKRNYTA